MENVIWDMIDACNATEEKVFWDVDNLTFIKREYKLKEPCWLFDDGNGEYGKYIMYHQGSFSWVEVFDGKLIQKKPTLPSENRYMSILEEEMFWIDIQLGIGIFKTKFKKRIKLLQNARNEIVDDHLTWYRQNNHESIKKSYERNQIISNILA